MLFMSKKKKTNCGDCRYQMSGFDGGFFGLPVTCECHIFGETENRKSCSRFEKRMSKGDLFERISLLEKENEELRKELDCIKKTNKSWGRNVECDYEWYEKRDKYE